MKAPGPSSDCQSKILCSYFSPIIRLLSDNHLTDYRFVIAHLSVNFNLGVDGAFHVHKNIVALGLLVNLVCEPFKSPFLDGFDCASERAYKRLKFFDGLGLKLVVNS